MPHGLRGHTLERVLDTPILIKYGVSPDGEWVVAAVPSEPSSRETVTVPFATVAIPVRGGAFRRICGATCPSGWSPDGRFFWFDNSAETWVIAVAPDRMFPDLAAAGLGNRERASHTRGTRILPHAGASLGPDGSTYVFQKRELHANLFRIALP